MESESCGECSSTNNLTTCVYCNNSYCVSHVSGSHHNCDERVNRHEESHVSSRILLTIKQYGLYGITQLKRRYTYLLLVIMWCMFWVQVAVSHVSPDLFNVLFVVTTENPLYVWTWVIAVFSHGSVLHLLANMITLLFFGPIVESFIGRKRFIVLFVIAGVLTMVSQVVFNMVVGIDSAILGASGGVAMLLGLLAVYKPDIKILIFFIIPLRLWIGIAAFIAISIIGVFTTSFGQNIAHFAHLVGVFIGLTYAFLLPHDEILNEFDMEIETAPYIDVK